MIGRVGTSWTVIQSKPAKSAILNSILTKRFEHDVFLFRHFEGDALSEPKRAGIDIKGPIRKKDMAGVICELKHLKESEIDLFDRIAKEYKEVQMILILSPVSFRGIL